MKSKKESEKKIERESMVQIFWLYVIIKEHFYLSILFLLYTYVNCPSSPSPSAPPLCLCWYLCLSVSFCLFLRHGDGWVTDRDRQKDTELSSANNYVRPL